MNFQKICAHHINREMHRFIIIIYLEKNIFKKKKNYRENTTANLGLDTTNHPYGFYQNSDSLLTINRHSTDTFEDSSPREIIVIYSDWWWADDALIYRHAKSANDARCLQQDLNS